MMGTVLVSLAVACVTASPWITNTPLYTVRMEQQSSEMNFLPTAVNGFTYTTGNGYTLNCAVAGSCNSARLLLTGNTCWDSCGGTCEYTCWETCDGQTCEGTCSVTCESTCPSTCASTCPNTCDGPTCESTCGNTCEGTCYGRTCWDTCEKPCIP